MESNEEGSPPSRRRGAIVRGLAYHARGVAIAGRRGPEDHRVGARSRQGLGSDAARAPHGEAHHLGREETDKRQHSRSVEHER